MEFSLSRADKICSTVTIFVSLLVPACSGRTKFQSGMTNGQTNMRGANANSAAGETDANGPSVVLSSSTPPATSGGPIVITATFSNSVSGFSPDDVLVNNGVVESINSIDAEGKTYTVVVQPSGPGTVTASVKDGAVQDAAWNTNKPSNTISRQSGGSPVGEPLACSKSGAKEFDASVPIHQDYIAAKKNYYYDKPLQVGDALESQVVSINIGDIVGDVLPVSNFSLDDVAVIVRPSDSVASIYNWNEAENKRTINLPAHALLIYDGNNARYADGFVDSLATTLYNFGTKSLLLPGGQVRSLQEVYEMGMPLIPHNKVLLSDMRNRGFVDGANNIVFKMIHISHGYGWLTLKFSLAKCQ